MSQNDFTIANQGFPAFRADLNSALQALASNSSGTSAPSTTFANMWWYDSSNNIMYIRNEDNDAWIKFAELDQTNDKFVLSGTLQLDDGTVSAPALTFNSDTNMGIYRGGTDILKFVTAGTDAITIDASQLVGIGTTPSTRFHVYQATGNTALRVESAGTNSQSSINLKNDARRYDIGINSSDAFFISDDTASSTRMTITSAGNVGISDSSPSSKLTVGGSATTTAKPTVAIVDTTSGATMTMRGLSPKIAFDVTSSGVPKILMDNAGLEFKTGTLDAEGDVDVKIDSSGRLLLGTTTEGDATADDLTIANTSHCGITIRSGTSSEGSLFFSDGTSGDDEYRGFVQYLHSANALRFGTNSAERMRITSGGDVLVGTNSNTLNSLHFVHSSGGQHAMGSRVGTNGNFALGVLNSSGTVVGGVVANASSTAYNTSSDHRLKENVTADWEATTRLKQLNPVRFNFIADADTTVDGFLAHEVQSVVPEAITGTHNEVDADGNPVYQGIDQSKLVPLLVKTIQELEARIVALETA